MGCSPHRARSTQGRVALPATEFGNRKFDRCFASASTCARGVRSTQRGTCMNERFRVRFASGPKCGRLVRDKRRKKSRVGQTGGDGPQNSRGSGGHERDPRDQGILRHFQWPRAVEAGDPNSPGSAIGCGKSPSPNLIASVRGHSPGDLDHSSILPFLRKVERFKKTS